MSTIAPSAPRATARTPFWQAVGIVAGREIMTTLRSKAFVISTLLTLLGVAAAVVLSSVGPSLFASDTRVAVVGDASGLAGADGYVVEPVADEAAARSAIESGAVDAAVVPGEGPSGLTVLAEREAPMGLLQLLSVTPELELIDPSAPDPALTYLIGIGFGLVFFMSAMMFGQGIAQSVVEEKQSRIVEIMLAAVPARAILAGKIIASTALAFGQIALIAATVLIAGAATGSRVVLDGLGVPILWFVVLFAVGFVMLSALYAAGASLVSNPQDLATTTSPIMMLVMLPYFLVILFSNNPTALQIMSYVPFSAPVAVPMRSYLGTQEWWEPWLALGILAVATVLAVMLAARIYERSVLKTGKAVKWKDALRA